MKAGKTVFIAWKRGWDITKMLYSKDEQCTKLAEEIYADSCGRKGIGETPQCVSTRRLTSHPRKRSVFPERCISTNQYFKFGFFFG
jgi:hypothetical protein